MNPKPPPPMLREEPILGPNFAAEVLKKADRLMARRRRIRGAVAGVGMVCVTAAAVVIGVRAFSPTNTAPALRPPQTEALNDPTAGEQADALAYMFPDAAPLAQLDDTYFAGAPPADDPLSTDAGGSEDGG